MEGRRTSGRAAVRFRRILPCLLLPCLLAVLLTAFPSGLAAQTTGDASKTTAAPSVEDDAGSATMASEPRRPAFPRDPVAVAETMGWYFVVPFILASIIAVWFTIERLVVLRRARVLPRPFVQRFLQHLEQGTLDADAALETCEENGSPVAQVFAHGVRKWGKPSVEVEQAIIDGGERQVSQLRKHLRILNGVATVCPLIGLLGTVIGMIQAFLQIEAASAAGSVEIEKLQLATGIATALLTTATGLAIAIPSLIMYMYLSGRVDALVVEMDLTAQDVVHLISAEGLAGRPIPASRAAAEQPKGPKSVTARGKSKKAV